MPSFPLTVVAAVSLTLLLGCATVDYIPPPASTENKARVRVAQKTKSAGLEVLHLPDACRPDLTFNAGTHRRIARLDGGAIQIGISDNRAILGIPGVEQPTDSFTEFYVSTATPFHLGLSYKANAVYAEERCMVAASFQPERDKDYEVLFVRAGQRCSMTVRELTVVNNVVSRSSPLPFANIPARCK